MSMFADILDGLTGGVSGQLTDVGAVFAAGFGAVTDGKMWRSMGWLALGVVLFMIGFTLLVKELPLDAVGDVLGDVVKSAKKVAG
jgi:hypothetical protein